jgi:cysteine desulfurase / selenocysteine lyase
MSINTTSTSDRIATESTSSFAPEGTPEAAQEKGAQNFGARSLAPIQVPDPALIARLANEFFRALPGGLPEGPAVPDAASSAPPNALAGEVPGPAVPDYPRGPFSGAVAPEQSSVPSAGIPGGPQPGASPPTGALSEADFRAIAASLAGAMPFVPQVAAAAPPPAISGSSPASLDREQAGPWAAPPQFPAAAEHYFFPGVPAMVSPSAPPNAPPSGSELAAVLASPAATPDDAGRTDPWAAAPHFAGLNDVFSFPRVPGASVPGAPEGRASLPSLSVSQPAVGTIPAAPGATPDAATKTKTETTKTSAPESIPAIPNSAPPFAIAEGSDRLSAAKTAGYPGAAAKFPTVSEMFSFPGVPGAQSVPGLPVLPTSLPTKPPSESDLRALPGASASTSEVPGFQLPTTLGSSGTAVDAEPAAPRPGSLPAGIESVEFRPDIVPYVERSNRPLDPRLIRRDFPILEERVNGRTLIWLDNAATTQKPNAVIDRLSYFYQHENSNIHRAAHALAARATDAYESAREKTRRFLNASSTREIIFVRGTTEAINLVAKSWGHRYVQKDDEVVITWLEHHANIVPWQQLCSEKGARLRVAPVNDRGEVILEEYEKLLNPRTRIVSLSQVSNALGTITPAREMVEMAHRHGARVLVDGAQAVSHMRVDVQALDCDFYVFSGHKIFGPTGIGVVYGKLDLLDTMPPWQGGGNMIVDVTFEKTTYNVAPARFEAGTGNIADAVGLGAALDYVEQVGMESIAAYEHELLTYATAGLLTVPGLRLIGTAREKAGVMSFVLDDVRTEDVGAALSQEGIAVRSGHHCAQPILRRMGVEATVRPSLALYNTYEEIDALVAALLRIQAGRSPRGL